MAMSDADRAQRYRDRKLACRVTELPARAADSVPKVAEPVEGWLKGLGADVNPGLAALARSLAATLDAGETAHPAIAAELRRTMAAIGAELRQVQAARGADRSKRPPGRLDELRAARAAADGRRGSR